MFYAHEIGAGEMHEYRVYKMDGDGIVGLAGALTCETDQAVDRLRAFLTQSSHSGAT